MQAFIREFIFGTGISPPTTDSSDTVPIVTNIASPVQARVRQRNRSSPVAAPAGQTYRHKYDKMAPLLSQRGSLLIIHDCKVYRIKDGDGKDVMLLLCKN
jgi:hypothetical protein